MVHEAKPTNTEPNKILFTLSRTVDTSATTYFRIKQFLTASSDRTTPAYTVFHDGDVYLFTGKTNQRKNPKIFRSLVIRTVYT